jgi:hypothetical protein
MNLLRFLDESSPQKLVSVSIGDEKWFDLDNPQNSIWLAFWVVQSTRVRMDIGARKIMIWICFLYSELWCGDVASWEKI